MTTLASVAVLLGAGVLMVDLGNRLFGSYARTASGAAARILLLVALVLLLASPLIWLASDPDSTAACRLLYGSAAVSAVVVVHFLFPYRWGVHRVGDRWGGKRRPLVEGVVLTETTVAVTGLPEQAEGISCLILSDLHCNSRSKLELIGRAVDQLQTTDADLVFLLGDFGEKTALLAEVVETVGKLQSRYGTYCVLGNHDCEGGRRQVLAGLLQRHSMRLLQDEVHRVEALRISLLGVAYPWTRKPRPRTASNGFVLALTHSPDNILHFGRWNVAVGFAGHTHGGKLRLPGLGAMLNPSLVGRFLDQGWFARGDALMYVTPGIGYFPGRSGSGEIVRVTLTVGRAADGS